MRGRSGAMKKGVSTFAFFFSSDALLLGAPDIRETRAMQLQFFSSSNYSYVSPSLDNEEAAWRRPFSRFNG